MIAGAITEAWCRERAAYYRVLRLRAIYGRARARMACMAPVDRSRLHYRLKDRECAAIEAHQEAMQRLRTIGGAALSREEGFA